MLKWTLLFLGLSVAGFAVQSQADFADIEVDRKYVAKDGRIYEGLGACSLTSDHVECWDMEGNPDLKLTSSVRAYLEATLDSIALGFGKKNRILVLRTPGPGSMHLQPVLGSPPKLRLLQTLSFGNLYMLSVIADPQAQSASLSLGLYGEHPTATAEVPFHSGAEVAVEGVTFQVGKWMPIKQDEQTVRFSTRRGQKIWRILVGREGQDAWAGSTSFSPIFGKPARYVDLNGNPVTDLRLAEEGAKTYEYSGKPGAPEYSTAWLQESSNRSSGVVELISNVNPAQIKSLKIRVSRLSRIRIKGFPLDPK